MNNSSRNRGLGRLLATVSAAAAVVVIGGAVTSGTAWADTGSAGGQNGESSYAADPIMDPVFVRAMRSQEAGWPAATSDADLIRLGHHSCKALDSGQNLIQVLGTIQSESPSTSLVQDGFLIGASTAAYCPSHLPAVKEQAEQLSNNPRT